MRLLEEQEAAAVQRRMQMQEYAKAKAVVEHYSPEGICRVCGQAAPYIPTRRRDGLRFCINPECKREAHRRDNLLDSARRERAKRWAYTDLRAIRRSTPRRRPRRHLRLSRRRVN